MVGCHRLLILPCGGDKYIYTSINIEFCSGTQLSYLERLSSFGVLYLRYVLLSKTLLNVLYMFLDAENEILRENVKAICLDVVGS